MNPTDEAGPLFADIPFESLMAHRFGGEPVAWEGRFEAILDAVMRAMKRRFGDADLASDAALSAIRTFVRRVRHDGYPRLTIEGPKALEGLLVLIAFRKVIRTIREAERAKDTIQELSLARDAWDEPASGDRRDRLRSLMATTLGRMLDELRLSMESEIGRKIVRDVCLKLYRRDLIDDEEIARRAGCSTRTVGRVRKEVEQKWPAIAEQGRLAIQEIEAELGGSEA